MSTVTSPDLTKEQQWCIAIRVILKKNAGMIGDGGSKKLKEKDSAAREKLVELKKKNPEKFAMYEKRYKSLSEQAENLPKLNQDSALLVAKELDLMKLQIEHELALANPKNSKEITSTRDKLDKASRKLSEKFEELLKGATGAIEELEVRSYSAKSESFLKLKQMHTKLKSAYASRNNDRNKVFDYAGSITALADWPSLSSSAKTEIDNDENNQKKQAGAKGHYESKVDRLNRLLESLKGRLGVEDIVSKVENALAKGAKAIEFIPEDHVQEPKYSDGYEILKKAAGSTDSLSKLALKQENKVLQTLDSDKDIKDARSKAETALAELVVKGAELISRDEHTEHQLEIQKLLVRCVSAKNESPKAMGQVLQQLASLTKTFKEIATEKATLRQQCNALVTRFETARDELSFNPSPDERGLLNDWAGTYREAQAFMGSCDFESAEESLTELVDEVEKAVVDSENTAAKWEVKWKGELKIAEEFVQDNPGLSEYNKKLAAGAIKSAKNQADSKMFAAAIETLITNFGYLKTAGTRESFQNSDEYKNAKSKIAGLLSNCDESLGKLVTKLQQAGANSTAIEEQNERLTAARTHWSGLLKNSSNAQQLDAENFETRCIQLKTDYDNLAKNAKALRGAVKRGEYKELLKRFNDASALAEKELESLAAIDRGKVYQDLAHEHEQIANAAPDRAKGYPGSTASMNSLKTAVTKAMQETTQRHATALTTFNTKRESVATELKKLKKSAAETLKRGERDTFDPFFKEIDSDLETLGGIATSTSITMLQNGAAECDKLLKQIAQITKDMTQPVGDLDALVANALGKNDEDIDPESFGLAQLFDEDPQGDPILSDKVAPTFQLVAASTKSLQSELDDDDNLKECKPTQKAQLAEELTKLGKSVKSLEPKDAMKKLMAFQKTLTTAIEEAAQAAADRKTFGQLKENASNSYKKLVGVKPDAKVKIGGDDRECFAEMAKEFSAAKALATSEGKEIEAIAKMTKLQEKITLVAGSPGELQKEESAAQARKLKAETEKKKFDGLVEAYEKVTLPRVKKALEDADGGDKSQYEDCENLLKKAKEHFKKTKDFTGAETYLGLAQDRAKAAIEFPLGTAATARNQLHKSAARWRKSVLAFNKSIDIMLAKVKKTVAEESIEIDDDMLAGDDPIDDVNDLAKSVKQTARALSRLKRLFDPNVFDDTVSIMSAKKPKPAEVREAREEGLREVRRAMRIIMKDPLIIKLVAKPHPFGRIESSSVYTALRDLDLNLQRSV